MKALPCYIRNSYAEATADCRPGVGDCVREALDLRLVRDGHLAAWQASADAVLYALLERRQPTTP